MAKTPLPELVEAYQLIKAGQRDKASQILRTYLSAHPRDVDGWWMMAHTISKPENIQKCLERVLALDPNHAKAQAKLAQLKTITGGTPAEATQQGISTGPTAAPAVQFGDLTASNPFEAPVSPPDAAPGSFETFASGQIQSFDINPFGTPDSPPVHLQDVITSQIFIPSAARTPDRTASTAAGAATPPIDAARPKLPQPHSPRRARPAPDLIIPARKTGGGVETIIGIAVILIALAALIVLALYAADQKGLINLGGGLPSMTQLNAASFTLEYPKGWDATCMTETTNHPVCGIASRADLNLADQYTQRAMTPDEIDINTIYYALYPGPELPHLRVIVVAMDVPETSPSYSGASTARMVYDEAGALGYFTSDRYRYTFDDLDITVDGHPAYYYALKEKTVSGRLVSAYYDLYVPHDGVMFWMTIWAFAVNTNQSVPDDTIQHMIQTIKFK